MATRAEKQALRDQGLTYEEIGRELGISTQAVWQAIGGRDESKFYVFKPTGCVFPGLRRWLNANRVSRRELMRRMGRAPVASSMTRLSNKLAGRTQLRKSDIDAILAVTGMTYEEAFGGGEERG